MALRDSRITINWPLVIRWGVLWLMLGGLALYTAWPWLSGKRSGVTRTLVVYGFSILGEVMNDGIFPAFQAEWRKQTGEHVEFISSFAGSGTVTNQIIMGVPAEMAILSLELDALRLVEGGVLNGPRWQKLPSAGVLNRSPIIILVRAGNPKQIKDYADLTKPGIGIVHPDPLTSGAANWSIIAEYGAALHRDPHGSDAGYRLLLGIWRNVVAQAASARSARSQFDNGFGDALVTYEQEPLREKAQGKLKYEIVYPESTIFTEHIVVVVEKNIKPEQRALVNAFQNYLWQDSAQKIFVRYGFRSVTDRLNGLNPDFGKINHPFLVSHFGGWVRAKREIIDPVWKDRVLQELRR